MSRYAKIRNRIKQAGLMKALSHPATGNVVGLLGTAAAVAPMAMSAMPAPKPPAPAPGQEDEQQQPGQPHYHPHMMHGRH